MSDSKTPLVSVVIPAYNAGDFLRESLNSIINQSYKNIEIIIVDDCSKDNTQEILKEYKKLDSRIRIFRNKTNLGVSASAMFAIKKCKGQFVARMDADDIAILDRIEKQVKFLIKNPDVVVVGGQCQLIDNVGFDIGMKKFPLDDLNIRKQMFSHIPMQQPTLMFNKKLLPKNFVWYDKKYRSAEEIELMFKLFKLGKASNLDSTVLKYRMHKNNVSLVDPKKTFYLTLKTRLLGMFKYGYVPTIGGVFTTLLQIIFVFVMPSSLIYPIYMYLRGMRKINLSSVRIKLYVPNFFKKAYQLAQG